MFQARARTSTAWQEVEDDYPSFYNDAYDHPKNNWSFFASMFTAKPMDEMDQPGRKSLTDIFQADDFYKKDTSKKKSPRKREDLYSSRRPTYYARPKRNQHLLDSWKHEWIKEELHFAMNKISLFGLIIALMFLGALFFTSGFLMAVNLYGIGAPKSESSIAGQSTATSHLPSNNPVAAVQNMKAVQERNAGAPMVPAGYATMGGVAMVQSSHVPTYIQQKQNNVQTGPQRPVHMPTQQQQVLPQQQVAPQQQMVPQQQMAYPPANNNGQQAFTYAYPSNYAAPQQAAPAYNNNQQQYAQPVPNAPVAAVPMT